MKTTNKLDCLLAFVATLLALAVVSLTLFIAAERPQDRKPGGPDPTVIWWLEAAPKR